MTDNSPYADGAVYVTSYTSDFYPDRSLALFQVQDGRLNPLYIPEEPLNTQKLLLKRLDKLNTDTIYSVSQSRTLGKPDSDGRYSFLGYRTEVNNDDLWVRHEGICGGKGERFLRKEGYTVKNHHNIEADPRIVVALRGTTEEGRALRIETEIDKEQQKTFIENHRDDSFETLWRPIHTSDLSDLDDHAISGWLESKGQLDTRVYPAAALYQAYREHAETATIIVRHEKRD